MTQVFDLLEELIEEDRSITYGVVKPGDDPEEGVLFLRGGDIAEGKILTQNLRRITNEVSTQYKRTLLKGGELVVSLVGNPGEVAVVPEDMAGTNIARQVGLVPLKPDVNAKFIMYFLRSPLGKAELFTRTKGAVQQVINLADLKTVRIPRIDEESKEKIASFVGAYDDLIENNRRRIQLLEESARLLYQEWFVHLRFPGHEQVKIIDGVPEGWDRLSVAECCEKSTYGYTASASQDAIGPKFLRITDIVPSSISWADVPYCEADEATTKKYQLKEGDIVVARTGATVGYAKRMPSLSEPVIYASYLVKFSPNKSVVDDLLLGVFMESEQYKDFVRGNAGGAAQPNANAQILGGAKLLVPSELLQKEFRSNVAPLIEQKFLLEKQNASLAQARDILLPKIMSGELTI